MTPWENKGQLFVKSRICKLGVTSQWDLSWWTLFFFLFFQMDKLGSVFYVFQTPGISVGPYSLAFPFPSLFFPHFSQLAAALLCPPFLPLSYLLLCNLFAARLSLWFTGPLLSRIIINGLLCCIPASSPPLCSLGQAPCKQDACSLHRGTCSHALINPLHLSLAKYNGKSQVIHLRPN